MDDNGDHVMTDAETWVNETFATNLDMSSRHYDAAGNLTDDGIYKYTYDAWNRLVKVQRPGITCLSELGWRPIHAEPVHEDNTWNPVLGALPLTSGCGII
jgi:YD repeat-containing protein